jgi:hypothetical protein
VLLINYYGCRINRLNHPQPTSNIHIPAKEANIQLHRCINIAKMVACTIDTILRRVNRGGGGGGGRLME